MTNIYLKDVERLLHENKWPELNRFESFGYFLPAGASNLRREIEGMIEQAIKAQYPGIKCFDQSHEHEGGLGRYIVLAKRTGTTQCN